MAPTTSINRGPRAVMYSVHTGWPQVRIIPPQDSSTQQPGLPTYLIKPDQNNLPAAFAIVFLQFPLDHQPEDHLSSSTLLPQTPPLPGLLSKLFKLCHDQIPTLISKHIAMIQKALAVSSDGLYLILDCPQWPTFGSPHEDLFQVLHLMAYYQEIVALCDIGLTSDLILAAVMSSTARVPASETSPPNHSSLSTTCIDFHLIAATLDHEVLPPRTNYQIYTIPTLANFHPDSLAQTLWKSSSSSSSPPCTGQRFTSVSPTDFPIARAICHIMRSIHLSPPPQWGLSPNQPKTMPIAIVMQELPHQSQLQIKPTAITTPTTTCHFFNLLAQFLLPSDPVNFQQESFNQQPTAISLSSSISQAQDMNILCFMVDCFKLHDLIHSLKTPSPSDSDQIIANANTINLGSGIESSLSFRTGSEAEAEAEAGTKAGAGMKHKFPYTKSCIGGSFDHLHTGHHLLLLSSLLLSSNGLILGITAAKMLQKKAYLDQMEPWALRVAQVLSYCQLFKGSCSHPFSHPFSSSSATSQTFSEHLKLIPPIPDSPQTSPPFTKSTNAAQDLQSGLDSDPTTIPQFSIPLTSFVSSPGKGSIFDVLIEPLYDMYGPSIKYQFDCLILSQEVQKGGPLVNTRRLKALLPETELFVVPLLALPQVRPRIDSDGVLAFTPASHPDLKVCSTDLRYFYSTIKDTIPQ